MSVEEAAIIVSTLSAAKLAPMAIGTIGILAPGARVALYTTCLVSEHSLFSLREAFAVLEVARIAVGAITLEVKVVTAVLVSDSVIESLNVLLLLGG